MADFKLITHGGASPNGKPRVYFTCHPDDRDKYLETICNDIFKTQDCAVLYTEDMSAPIESDSIQADLGQMNLFVVPVTYKLLSDPCRAMQVDIPYARENNIPILPFMMEQNIDRLYSDERAFGKLQYLSPYSNDATEISYGEKLRRYLQDVLVSDEMARRVRAAFDAYIFLSYRKKDRKYANQLMRLIHKAPEFSDIAIWYDEFLTPGESFEDSIKRALEDSALFAMLVTPNILEEPDGKPNFVMGQEYPAALTAKKSILPVEMQATDRARLEEKFEEIPNCVDPSNEDMLKSAIASALSGIARADNGGSPEHRFLIGIAYLDGIDVEVDRDRALELITFAANGGVPEAMVKLYNMYKTGKGVGIDYIAAHGWASKHSQYCVDNFGVDDKRTVFSISQLATSFFDLGEYRQALTLYEKVYEYRREHPGEDHINTLKSLENISMSHRCLGEYDEALKADLYCYDIYCKKFGDNHPVTTAALHSLALTYGMLGEHQRSLALMERVYGACCDILGTEHPETIQVLNNIGQIHLLTADYERSAQVLEKAYEASKKVLGEEHPDTLSVLNNLAGAYGEMGQHKRSLEIFDSILKIQLRVLGGAHPDTIMSVQNMATAHFRAGEYGQALHLFDTAYNALKSRYGEDDISLVGPLNDLASVFLCTGKKYRAVYFFKRAYKILLKARGEDHPDTVKAKDNYEWARSLDL